MPFVSMGIVHTQNRDYEVYQKSRLDSYHKIVFSPEGDKLIGALFVGDIANAGIYRAVIREGMNITRIKKQIIEHNLHYGCIINNS